MSRFKLSELKFFWRTLTIAWRRIFPLTENESICRDVMKKTRLLVKFSSSSECALNKSKISLKSKTNVVKSHYEIEGSHSPQVLLVFDRAPEHLADRTKLHRLHNCILVHIDVLNQLADLFKLLLVVRMHCGRKSRSANWLMMHVHGVLEPLDDALLLLRSRKNLPSRSAPRNCINKWQQLFTSTASSSRARFCCKHTFKTRIYA